MKNLLFALLIRCAVVCFDGNSDAHAFTSTSLVLPRESIMMPDKSRLAIINQHYHHMGDLDHDLLPEADDDEMRQDNRGSENVIVFDDAEVALNDEAWDLAMKSIMAFFVAMVIAFGGGGIFKPRPVLAVEPMDFSSSTEIVTTRVVTPSLSQSIPSSSL